MPDNRYIPSSLNAKQKLGWFPRLVRGIASRIDPEIYEQERQIGFDQYGVRNVVYDKKSGRAQFGEIDGGNQFAIERPGAGTHINPAKAFAHLSLRIRKWALKGDDREKVNPRVGQIL
jgi:hypothetical protein